MSDTPQETTMNVNKIQIGNDGTTRVTLITGTNDDGTPELLLRIDAQNGATIDIMLTSDAIALDLANALADGQGITVTTT